MPQFIKGESGNKSGRPKGAKGKTTEMIRDNMRSFVARNMARIQKDFETLEPKERIMYWLKVAAFVIPNPDIDISKMTESDLDLIIQRIKEKEAPQEKLKKVV